MLAALLKSYNVRLKHLSLLLGWCSLFFFFLLKAVPSEVVSNSDIIWFRVQMTISLTSGN